MSFASPTIRRLLVSAFVSAIAAQDHPAASQQDLPPRDVGIRPLPNKPAALSVPRGYALVIGVAKYKNLESSDNLQFSETDADAIYRVLISQEGGAFPAENVHRLIGPQATLHNIKQELEQWLPSVAKEPDRVVVYFAGHGLVKGGRGYVAPYDVDQSNLEQTAYPMDKLGKIMAQDVKARWKVLLADACHSAKITPETSAEAIDAQLSGMPKTLLTLTATRQQEQSYEDPKLGNGFGLFTYYLVNGLRGEADKSPCDGAITADELIEYVRNEVKSYAWQRGKSQTPQEYGDFDPKMILGVRQKCLGGTVPPSLSLGSIIIESNMDDVQVYIDDKPFGTAAKGKPLAIPGLATGTHIVKGVRKGYEPDTKEVIIVPGQERSVTLRIQYRQEFKHSAVGLVEQGEKHLFKRMSVAGTFNPLVIYRPGRQTQVDVKTAKDLFMKALKEEPKFGRAALDLARACQLLLDTKAMLEAFRLSIKIDPTDTDAIVQYAGALIEDGDPDTAIRQLAEAIRLEPNLDLAYSHLSRAYLDKGVWDRAIEAADKAIGIEKRNDQPYLWKADALRRKAPRERDSSHKLSLYQQSVETYQTYLRLTNFSTPAYEQFAYYIGLGFGLGSRHHADRQVSYAYQRSLAYMGLCDCEDKLGSPLRASEYCERAIKYDPTEPIAYFLMGNAYRDLFNSSIDAQNCTGQVKQLRCRGYLTSALSSYTKMLKINPDLDLSRNARAYVEDIGATLHMISK